ncbi:uncharacterized protein Z519_09342 [Cladophialophora bantiana CBS 173.52]|uniref:Cytochrome P450 oxidoreductase n=1 Tax=Cladophialophora bantiana (strain ATCC 10958 / CBS 173.52 / CDC B-1940 / NIH 8579) TaxID=1442370 RepID=A0A0D2H9H6_CLAB1|nr:uncharacterized protein Z519_09342 [Cladophialophora bantiana CBS 173.52]KIW89913.1 hypothetical protein Z519_09342 [Cladophialophora bantiana CBS 173.52]
MWIGIAVAGGRAEHLQRSLHKDHGPLVRIAHDEVSVADPSAVKVIYNIKSGFTKTDFYPPFAPNISPHGDHFTQLDEAKHAERRKYVNAVYSMSTILESETYIDACTDVFLENMARFAETGSKINFGEWIQWYTFDVIGELFFGHQFGFMRDAHDYGQYIQSLDTLLPGIALSCVLPAWLRPFHSTVGMLFPTIRASIRGFDEIRVAGRSWTDVRRRQIQAGTVERVDLLGKFFQIMESKDGWDIRDIQNEACVAIFAGSDTTAIAIRSILYHLMRRPECMRKLVAEIDVFDNQGLLSKPHIRYTEAMKMPYLVACCKEGMRLHPSVGLGMPRHVPPGGATIAGRYFPAGSRVSINAAVLHYDKSIFGPDAAEFNPDRWIQRDAALMDRHMLHFGGGSRTCIGKNISMAEIHKLIPSFLRRFNIELADPDRGWKTENFWFNKQTGIYTYVTAR